jgi:hypothetical protein
LILSWSKDAAGYRLESTPDFTLKNWNTVQVAPVEIGDRTIYVPSTSALAAFFRLRQDR